MSKVIRVDAEVYEALQERAEPLTDTPNDVIRRLLGLDPPPVVVLRGDTRDVPGLGPTYFPRSGRAWLCPHPGCPDRRFDLGRLIEHAAKPHEKCTGCGRHYAGIGAHRAQTARRHGKACR